MKKTFLDFLRVGDRVLYGGNPAYFPRSSRGTVISVTEDSCVVSWDDGPTRTHVLLSDVLPNVLAGVDRERERILTRLAELQARAKAHADGLRYCMPDSAATEDASEMTLALRSLSSDLRKMWGAS